MDTKELRFKDEVFAIVGVAMEVHRALGPEFPSSRKSFFKFFTRVNH